MPVTRYGPIGRCIYCGSTHDLTKEHIIPKGLKGTLELLKSSCLRCAKITGGVERLCQRNMMGRFRRRVGIKSPKPQPTHLDLRIHKEDGTEQILSVPIPDLPLALTLPLWRHEPYLPFAEETPFKVAFWGWVHNDAQKAVAKLGGTGFEAATIEPITFSRMIAKIAHSYAVARYGLGAFKPLLIEHILTGVKNPNPLIGGPAVKPEAETNALHNLWAGVRTCNGKNYLLCEVRLFAQMGAPVYLVLVGEV